VLDALTVLCKLSRVHGCGHGEAAGRVILPVIVSAELSAGNCDTPDNGQGLRTSLARELRAVVLCPAGRTFA